MDSAGDYPFSRRAFLKTTAQASVVAAIAGAGLPRALLAQAQGPEEPADYTLRDTFDRIDQSINDGQGQAHQTNEEGVLGWQQSYIQNAYLAAYRAHRDPRYLDKFVEQGLRVLSQRDSERGAQDYRGVSAPLWSARRYSMDESPVAGPVCTGMITHSLAGFARLIRATPALQQVARYREAAAAFQDACIKAIDAHEFQWRDSDEQRGTYIFPRGMPMSADGIELPHNMNHTMARTLLHLAALTGQEQYRDRVRRIVQLMRDDLRMEDNAYVWEYHWRQSRGYLGWTEEENISANRPSFNGNRRPEDTSHGAISMDLVTMMHREGMMFDEQDLQRFANTLLRNILVMENGRLSVTRFVDGSGGTDARWETAAGLWVVLAPWERQVHELLLELYHSTVGIPSGTARRAAALNVAGYFNLIAQDGSWEPDADLPPQA